MPNQEERILRELKSLREEVKRLRERVEILEKQQALQPPEPIPYREVPEEAAKPLSLEELAVRRVKEEVKGEIIRPPEKKPKDIEKIIGQWLPRIGMLALLFGLGFFLKYAFEHQWIGPTGRIVLGLFGGVLLLGAGEYFESKKYHKYARVFTGGGLGLLYFSLYAARNFYQLIGVIPTFISMLLVTLAAGFFAVRYNSRIVAFYSIIGGFLTPFLIGYKGLEDRISLLSYIAVLNLGVLGLAFFKKWRILNFAAFIATAITYLVSYGRFHSGESLFASFGFLTAYFLIFAFVAFLYNILYRLPTLRKDVFLIIFNAAYYYGFSYYLLKPDYNNLLGFFTFGVAAFYLILAYLAFSRNSQDKFLASVLLATSVAFLTTGIAVQFEQYWITVFWTIEALGLLWIGFKLRQFFKQAYFARILALAVFALTLGRLIFVDSRIPLDEFTPILNKRVFVFLLYVIALFLAAKLYSYYKETISKSERKISTVVIIIANFLMVFLMSVEIIDYFGLKIKELSQAKDIHMPSGYYGDKKIALGYQRNAFLSIAWALYSILLMVVGIIKRYKPIRLVALLLFGVTTFKVFFVDLSYLKGFPRILSFIVLGVILLGAGFLYNKYKDKIRAFV